MDVTSTTSSTAGSNYRYQRDVSGDISSTSRCRVEVRPAASHRRDGHVSLQDVARTSRSIYTGNSGAPFDFVYGVGTGTARATERRRPVAERSDLRAEERARPRTRSCSPATTARPALQTTAATWRRRSRSSSRTRPACNTQRGTIMTRNSCRNPWVNEVRRLGRAVARQVRWQRSRTSRLASTSSTSATCSTRTGASRRSRIRARPAARSAARRCRPHADGQQAARRA